MRLIDADEYRKYLIDHMTVPWERAKYNISDDYNKGLYDAVRMLNIEPTIQPEIIRCRECKFASGDSRICMKFNHSPIGELDFCSWAERREVTT